MRPEKPVSRSPRAARRKNEPQASGLILSGWPQAFVAVLAVFFLLLAVGLMLWREANYLPGEWPVLRLWPDAAAQQEQVLGQPLDDTLRVAQAALPPEAPVLLVTPGTDVRHGEYVAYHRALYHLAPRPVWWVNPAPSDGTWEARWWTPTPLSVSALDAFARGKGIRYLLFYQADVPPGLGPATALTDQARLVALAGAPLLSAPPARAPSGLVWPDLGLIPALLLILVAGYGVLWLIGRLGYAPTRIEAAALAWALGTGAVSLALFALNGLGLSVPAQIVVLAIGLGAVGLALGWGTLRIGLRHRAARGPAAPPPSTLGRAHLIQGLLSGLIGVEVAYVALLAVGRPLIVWDSWVNWALKARIILLDGRITAAAFSDPSRLVTQLDYPLLAPLVQVWTFGWTGTGALDDRWAGVPAVGFFLALLGVCYSLLRRFGAGRTVALALVAALGAMVHIYLLAALVFVDVPLTLYAASAGGYAALWLRTRNRGALAIAALAGGLLPWTKREGLILLAMLCLALLLAHGRRRRAWLAVGAFAGAALALSGPWWAFVAANRIPNVAFLPINWATFQANAGRLPVIARYELQSLLSVNWAFVWPVVAALALPATRGRQRWRVSFFLPLAGLLYLVTMGLGYVFSDFVPYQQHILSSIDRILAHVLPLAMLWLGGGRRQEA